MLTNILIMLFFLSILNTMRHIYYLIQTLLLSTKEDPIRYILSNSSLLLLGLSISFMLTFIYTNI
jgi:hypothetical protein